ncbi:TIGR01244 family phosphatase [Qipengyuania sp. YG27]|uniref:TIGR01244 family phosphatase n=1 Tax=Qipengyuania mesophila TaxID=2867246 RepID=A0ABS7JTY8_9SPHN|nr:TIGR01244 family phosphatase [Qipengyuania mesophila]
MSQFRKLSDTFYASPQVTPGEISEAAAMGITLVVNNRPDGEAPDQPPGAEIEAAARAAGMDYLAIPVGSAGFSEPQVEQLQQALAGAAGPVLGFCRSGTRSTLLWSLAQARSGEDPEEIAEAAAEVGYDVAPVRPAMDMLAARARG